MLKYVLTLVLALLAWPVAAQTDAFNLQAAQIVNAPDIRSWPITTAITSVSFDGAVSRFEFTKHHGPNRWPDVTPEGWDGPIQYTVWLFRQYGGQWVGSGFIQFWENRDGTGDRNDPDVPSRYNAHWFYGTGWRPLVQSDPIRPGEQIGFMVAAGSQRAGSVVTSVQERSNVVVVPATDNGRVEFFQIPITPTPVIDPVPTPTPDPSGDIAMIFARLSALESEWVAALKRIAQLESDLSAATAALKQIDTFESRLLGLELRVNVLASRPVPVSCTVSAVYGIKLSCKLGY